MQKIYQLSGPHRTHELRTIATDVPRGVMCLSATRLRHAKTAKRIEVLFEMETPEAAIY